MFNVLYDPPAIGCSCNGQVNTVSRTDFPAVAATQRAGVWVEGLSVAWLRLRL